MNNQLKRLLTDYDPGEVLKASILVEELLLGLAENLVLAERRLVRPICFYESYRELREYEARRRALLSYNLVDEELLRRAALKLLRGSG
jgi:hypothetical protein